SIPSWWPSDSSTSPISLGARTSAPAPTAASVRASVTRRSCGPSSPPWSRVPGSPARSCGTSLPRRRRRPRKRLPRRRRRPRRRRLPRLRPRERRVDVRRSEDRILTTHTGSLIRPPDLIEALGYGFTPGAGAEGPAAGAEDLLTKAVADIVSKQTDVGL